MCIKSIRVIYNIINQKVECEQKARLNVIITANNSN